MDRERISLTEVRERLRGEATRTVNRLWQYLEESGAVDALQQIALDLSHSDNEVGIINEIFVPHANLAKPAFVDDLDFAEAAFEEPCSDIIPHIDQEQQYLRRSVTYDVSHDPVNDLFTYKAYAIEVGERGTLRMFRYEFDNSQILKSRVTSLYESQWRRANFLTMERLMQLYQSNTPVHPQAE